MSYEKRLHYYETSNSFEAITTNIRIYYEYAKVLSIVQQDRIKDQ